MDSRDSQVVPQVLTHDGSEVIPAPRGDGWLPAGRYASNIAEIRATYVEGFQSSLTREQIFDRWLDRRRDVMNIVPIVSEWVNGSFVGPKRDPTDIDIVTFIAGSDFDALTPTDRTRLADMAGFASRYAPRCDARFVEIRADGHDDRTAYLRSRGYWDEQWSNHYEVPLKGYLEVSE